VLTITVSNTLVPSAEPGRLVLVDLAGSERAADRSAHTKDRMDEVCPIIFPIFASFG
jgi:kinesin family protein 2/24